MIFIFFSVLISIIINLTNAEVTSILQGKYDGYGVDWIFMPDGNDKPQVAILKELQNETRGILDINSAVSYILYTRSNAEKGTPLFLNNMNALKNSDFSPSRKTKFITHGWKSSALSASQIEMKNVYLENGDYNVFLVDWQPLAASTFYLGPMRNTEQVGQNAGQFIDFLISETGLSPKDIHFIGHSLGAHVAGNAGSATKFGRISRVTGLDPALPGFHIFATEKERLDPSDANFVDVIHSCGGVLGFLQPLGHIDFYPNAGTAVQPGCCCIPELLEACSHGRSYSYFTESINKKSGLVATQCDTWDSYVNKNCESKSTVLMGEYVDKSATGSYFLKTRSEPPFAYTEEINNHL